MSENTTANQEVTEQVPQHSKEEKLNKIYELSNFSDTKFDISADIIQTKNIICVKRK